MIYVDPLMEHNAFGHRYWCHMGTDDHSGSGLEELHAIARRIGLRRSWFQDKPYHPHYDVTASKRPAAIRAGAVEVGHRDYPKKCGRNPVLLRMIAENEAAESEDVP